MDQLCEGWAPIQITGQRLRYARTILPILSILPIYDMLGHYYIAHIAHIWVSCNQFHDLLAILAWEGVGDEMTLIFADQKKREWPKPPHDQCVQLDHNTNCPLTFFSAQFHQENCSQAFLDFYKSYHSPKTLKLSKLIRLLMEFFIGSNGGSFGQVAE